MVHIRSRSMQRIASVLLSVGWWMALTPAAHAQGVVAFPVYRAEHALRGIYTHHYPVRWQAFEHEAAALTQAARQHCAGREQAADLMHAWERARLVWVAASNPAVGPVIQRRSQREIDFWPARPALLQRALANRPQSLAQMERVGGPAKGFPTMETLLFRVSPAAHCPYLVLIAEGIEAEAQALSKAFAELAVKDWTTDEEAARSGFAEWVNQWLGGLESLRWQQMELPIQKARTTKAGQPPSFARRRMEDNVADWRAQWQSLRAQARLAAGVPNNPPEPGKALAPIEALLLGKGHIALAERWGKAIDAATSAMESLSARPSERELLALSSSLKAVGSLYQGEVAAALDVPLGFSSADGD